MITKKLHDLVFGWDSSAFEGKGYWFVLGKNGTFARAATSKEFSMLGHPKQKFQNYQNADRVSSIGISTLITDKILGGSSIHGAIGQSIGEKATARITNIKRAFDPLNVISKMTGRSRFATTIAARMMGRSMKDARFFLGEKNLKDDVDGYGVSGSISETTKNILRLLSQNFEYNKKKDKKEFKDIEKNSKLKDKRNKQLIDALLGRGKFKHHDIHPKLEKKGSGGFLETLGLTLFGAEVIYKMAGKEFDKILDELDIKNLKFDELEKLIQEIEKVLKAKAEIVIDKFEGKTVSKELKDESVFHMPKPETPKSVPETPKSVPKQPETSSSVTVPKSETKPKVTIKQQAKPERPSASQVPEKTNTFEPVAKKPVSLPNITQSDSSIMNLIEQHEGVRYRPYKDTRGFWTVGIGHYIGKYLPSDMNRQFSKEEVMDMFKADYAKHKQAAERIPNFNKLNMQGKAALIDMTFNMGPNWWEKWPTFTKDMRNDNIPAAMNDLRYSKWYTEVGNRARQDVALLGTNKSMSQGTMLAKGSQSLDFSGESVSPTILINNKTVAMNTYKNNSMISGSSDQSFIHKKLAT